MLIFAYEWSICETKKVSLTFLHNSGGTQFLRLHSEEHSNLWEGKLERWKFDPVYYKNNGRNLVLDKLQFSRGLESRLSVLHPEVATATVGDKLELTGFSGFTDGNSIPFLSIIATV